MCNLCPKASETSLTNILMCSEHKILVYKFSNVCKEGDRLVHVINQFN